MNQENVGKFIKDLRKKNNLTQNQLADKLGVTFQAVSKWENGKSLPDISTLKLISELFNVNIDDLIDGKKKNNKFINIIIIVLLVIILIIGVLFLFRHNDSYFLSNVSTTCEEFELKGIAAYNKEKSSLFISVDYCGNEGDVVYKEISCILYEEYDNTLNKISTCKKENNVSLKDYELTINVDSFNTMCKKFDKSKMYLEVKAVLNNDTEKTYKIPLTLNENC